MSQALFDEAYPRDPDGFRAALLEARDYLGHVLAETWRRLSPAQLTYADAALTMLDVDRDLTGGIYQGLILDCVRWREIGSAVVGPRLTAPDRTSHAFSVRTMTPDVEQYLSKPSYYERWRIARTG